MSPSFAQLRSMFPHAFKKENIHRDKLFSNILYYTAKDMKLY